MKYKTFWRLFILFFLELFASYGVSRF